MTTFGKLLNDALSEQPIRGQVFWVANVDWQLGMFREARSKDHPALVCYEMPILTIAPGTSNRRAWKRKYGNPFKLCRPDVLNGRSSTFFLEFQKHLPTKAFGRFIGRIHNEDLVRLCKILDPSTEAVNEAN